MPRHHYADHVYLLMALHSGGTNVPCPEARSALMRMGYMTPANVSAGWRRGNCAFGMALTKKGQRRAQEIAAQIQEAPRRKYGPRYQPKSRRPARVYSW